MTVKEQKRTHVELDVKQLDDKELETLVSSILQTAPNGTLYAGNQMLQSSVSALGVAHTAFKTSNDAANAAQAGSAGTGEDNGIQTSFAVGWPGSGESLIVVVVDGF